MNKTNQLRAMLRDGPVSASSIRAAGIPTGLATALVRRGEAVRLSRGVYAMAEADYSEYSDYEVAAMAVPKGVFCLLSALRLHGLTDENPHGLCMAILHGYHAPAVSQPPMNFIFRTEPLFSSNVETRMSHGVAIRVYGLEQMHENAGKSVLQVDLPPHEEKPGLFDFGVQPDDLSFAFIYWDFVKSGR